MEGGVAKHHQPHSPGKSFKTYTKTDSTAECLAKLKNLLPNARLQKHTTEVRELTAAQSGCQQSLGIARYGDRYHSGESTDLLPPSFSLLQLALVEETIAYITYLESILSAANDQVGYVLWLLLLPSLPRMNTFLRGPCTLARPGLIV